MVNNGYKFEYHMFPVTLDREAFELNRYVLLELFLKEDNIINLIEAMQLKLQEAASEYRYEVASSYRDMIQSLTVIKNGIDGYKSLATKDILLKLPIPDGYKLFFVSSGNIINSRITTFPTEELVQEFILESRSRLTAVNPIENNEKSGIDFRDILYSEISSLSEEMIELL
jgi:excinuclease ABC subunit C